MKTLTEIRPNVYVAPEVDGRARHIYGLSSALRGFRLVLSLAGPAYVASFETLGWRKLHDVTPAEARELVSGESAAHGDQVAARYSLDAEVAA